jgi:hypothetical protein
VALAPHCAALLKRFAIPPRITFRQVMIDDAGEAVRAALARAPRPERDTSVSAADTKAKTVAQPVSELPEDANSP